MPEIFWKSSIMDFKWGRKTHGTQKIFMNQWKEKGQQSEWSFYLFLLSTLSLFSHNMSVNNA